MSRKTRTHTYVNGERGDNDISYRVNRVLRQRASKEKVIRSHLVELKEGINNTAHLAHSIGNYAQVERGDENILNGYRLADSRCNTAYRPISPEDGGREEGREG